MSRQGKAGWRDKLADAWDGLDLKSIFRAVGGLAAALLAPKNWVRFFAGLWEELELPRVFRQMGRGIILLLNPVNWARGIAWLWRSIEPKRIAVGLARLPFTSAKVAGESAVTTARSTRPLVLLFLPLLFVAWLVVGGGGHTDPRLKIARMPLKPPPDPAAARIAKLHKLLEPGESTASLHAKLARAYLEEGRLRDAAGEYSDALKLDQKNTDAYLGIMDVASSMKDVKSSLQLAQKAYSISPEDPEIQNRLGAALAADGQPEEAIKYFEKALKARSDNVVVLLNLATAHAQLQHWALADKYCAEANRFAPKDEIPVLLRSLFKLRNHGGAEAIAMLERVTSQHPTSAYAAQALASAQLDSGHPEAALKGFEKAQALRSDWIMPYLGAGLAGIKTQRWSDAEKNFQRALQLSPDSVVGKLGMAGVMESKGRVDDAMTIYKQVLSSQPDLYMALNNLAYHYAENGKNLESAYSMARKAAFSYPNDRSGWDTLGWVSYKLGRKVEALQYLEKAARLSPDSAVPHYHYAKALRTLGRDGDAHVEFAKAVSLGLPQALAADPDFSSSNSFRN